MGEPELRISSAVVVPPSLLSPDVTKEQIATFMGHAISMLEHLKQQNIKAGLTADKADKIYQDAMQELEKLKNKLEENVDRMKQAKESAKSASSASVDLNVSEIQSQLKQAEKELKQHKEKEKALPAEVEKIKREHDKVEKEVENFPKVMEEESSKELIRLSGKLTALTRKKEALSEKLKELEKELEQAPLATHRSEAKVARLEKQLEIASLRESIEKASQIKQQKRTALDDIQRQVNPAEKKALDLSDEIKRLERELRDEKKSVESKRGVLKDVKSKYDLMVREEIPDLEKELKKLESRKPSERDEAHQEKIYKLRIELQNKESRKLEFRTKIKELRENLTKGQEEITKLEQSLKQRIGEKAQHDLNLSKLQEKQQAIAQKYIESKRKVQSLENQLATSEKELKFFETNLSKKNLHTIKEQLKDAEKEIAKIIQQTQIRSVSAIGEKKEAATASRVETLAKGGWGAAKVHLLSVLSSTDRKAIKAFKEATKAMMDASKAAFDDVANESHVDQDRRAEFDQGSIDHRAGVIGLNGIYRIETSFSADKIKKQFESFKAQNLSDKERMTITRDVQIGQDTFTNEFIPLNGEFDKAIEKRGNLPTLSAFSNIFGSKGISSANRKEAHLVNGWESTLKHGDKVIFRALRHGITSDKIIGTFFGVSAAVKSLVSELLGKSITATHQQRSRVAAAELLEAAILEEIASQGLTLEQAQQQGITLNFNSVSLVTPDSLRGLAPGQLKQADEKEMLLYQALALNGYDVSQSGQLQFKLKGGLTIPIEAHINTFNFGVNEGAVKWGLGFGEQYEHNKKAMEGFVPQVQNFSQQVEGELVRERENLTEMRNQLQEKSKLALQREDTDPIWQELDTFQKEFDRLQQRVQDYEMGLQNAKQLLEDIQQMMADKKTYMEGGNQYEIGAKILNLSNVMDDTINSINKDRNFAEKLPGYKCAFNCMSGKDRTGFMDGVAKTLAIMAKNRGGRYPTHKELENPAVRKEFVDILVPLLIKGGTLKITQDETGFMGLKVQQEARIFGMELTDFLLIQGYSVMTSA